MPVALVELDVAFHLGLPVAPVVEAGEAVGVRQPVQFGVALVVIGLGCRGHDAMQAQAQYADQLEQVPVLVAHALGDLLPDGIFEGTEVVGQSPDGARLLPLQQS